MMSIQIFATRFALALVFGALIGLEREWRQRMAGTRTNTLVAGGAAAFAMAGSLILGDAAAQARIVAYIVSGVGFLGAGVIFKEKAVKFPSITALSGQVVDVTGEIREYRGKPEVILNSMDQVRRK